MIIQTGCQAGARSEEKNFVPGDDPKRKGVELSMVSLEFDSQMDL
jgi:hypothetical protein